jgi:hypothetical protein
MDELYSFSNGASRYIECNLVSKTPSMIFVTLYADLTFNQLNLLMLSIGLIRWRMLE